MRYETIDLRLAVSDDPVGNEPIKMTCPPDIHKARTSKLDREQSLAIYSDHVHCYGCNYHMAKPIEALAWLLKIPFKEAREIAVKYTNEALDAYRERAAESAKNDPLPSTLAKLYNQILSGPRSHRIDWFYARGLNDETIHRFDLGHDGKRFVIPVYDEDANLVTLRYRRDDAYDDQGPKYNGIKGRNGLYVYPEWRVAGDHGNYLVIVEGELDAARLWQEGIPAITVTNGAGQARKLPALIKEKFPRVTKLFIATDMDGPGREAARITKEAADSLGFQSAILAWEHGKDITEALQLGHDIKSTLRYALGR